ncbi:MAG: DUF72 domain-containing protein [Bryobacteraceae bacterium]
MINSERIHIGPSGWQNPEWVEAVSAGASPREHSIDRLLPYVDLLEIGSTAQAPLKPEIARLWLRKGSANPRLRWTAVLGRRFTRDRDLSPGAVAAWKAGLKPLQQAGRLAALVLEFPWAFRFNHENREFLIALRREFHEFRLAAEFLHESWLAEEALAVLARYRISFVNVDQPAYFRAMPPASVLTTSLGVVRLHGGATPDAFRELDRRSTSAPYLYSLEELEEWQPRLARLAAAAQECVVSFTNWHDGRSMVNALQMGEILGRQPLVAPAPLIRRYPAEMAAFRALRPVQMDLLAGAAGDRQAA